MGNGLTAIGATVKPASAGARETDAAGPGEGRSSPFAEVMESHSSPSASGSQRPSKPAPGGERRGAQADAIDAPARGEASPDETAEDGAGDLTANGIDELLELRAGPATAGDELASTEPGGPSAAGTGEAQWLTALTTAPPTSPGLPPPAAAASVADSPAGFAEAWVDGAAAMGLDTSGAATSAASAASVAVPELASGTADTATSASAQDAPGAATAIDARAGLRTQEASANALGQKPPELRSPAGSPAWADELGSRVTWMIDRGQQLASLSLTPENLGPLEVRIAVREGETTVWFGAANADTRAALEQSLPRLREMLGASGLALANAGVFSHTPRDPQRGFTAAALARASQEAGAEPLVSTVTAVTGRGLIDLYA